ncbi:MAG: hypothetical protein JWR10_1150 [Rubritepida sp.]|nr:hypothetical protein [Rubritepida sp.]
MRRFALMPTMFLSAWIVASIPPARSAPASTAFRDCKDCPQMVSLTGGLLLMGSPPGEAGRSANEGPQRSIRIAPFAIGRYSVTRAEYAVFVQETGRADEGCDYYDGRGMVAGPNNSWHKPGFTQSDTDPVVCVTPADADAYAGWLSARTGLDYRLPSEAEWEYAARAGDARSRPWDGDASSQCAHANGADRALQAALPNQAAAPCQDDFPFTAPSGQFPANGFGLHDMIGNAWQWIAGCYTPDLTGIPEDGGPAPGPVGCERVARGGSWGTTYGALRSAFRYPQDPDRRNYNFGFRVVRSGPRVGA